MLNTKRISMKLTIEKFPNGISLYQDEDGYKFTKDAVDLAKFCNTKHTDTVLEMCAGSGVVAFYMYSLNTFNKLYLNDIQHNNCEIIKKNIELNNLQDKAKCIEGNLKDLKALDFDKKFDVIVCNPPYFKLSTSKINEEYSVAISRHEIEITLSEIIEKASELIKDRGRFYLCMPEERLAETIAELHNRQFECKRIKLLTNDKGKVRLCLFEAVFRAKFGVRITIEKG